MSAPMKLRGNRERSEMCNMGRAAGEARGFAEANHRSVDFVDKEVAALEETPEDATEALRIDVVEGEESLDERVRIDRKDRGLISGAGDPEHVMSRRWA